MDAETEKSLRETLIKCPFEAAGCDQVISALDFADHIQKCRFSVVRCPYCQTPGQR